MFGHPCMKPPWAGLRRIDIFGLHNDWCANITALACVWMECVNVATLGWSMCSVTGEYLCGMYTFPLILIWLPVGLIGNIHKSIDGSLYPRRIILFLFMTSQCAFVNRTLHPASQSTRIPINDAINNLGTMCPVNTIGRPGVGMSHMCADLTLLPSGRLTA